jgi:acylphosphatase
MEAANNQSRVRLLIEGRVQGVFFRASAVEQATRLGVKGWVRNRRDGSVELLAEGEDTAVGALVTWCHHGPPRACVERVQVERQDYQGEFRAFNAIR